MTGDERREAIVQFIGSFWAENGYAPSFREIGAAVGLKQTSSIEWHLEVLRDTGMVKFVSNRARTVRVT